MTKSIVNLLAFASIGLVVVSPAGAADLNARLDMASDGKLLDSHFGRYGYLPASSIRRAGEAIHFQLPAETEGVGQTGLYSYFAVAGDFELTATFEIIAMPQPESGYGAGIGIAIEGKQQADNVALNWRQMPGRERAYVVSHGAKQETKSFATRAESGRLALRRENREVICLAADDGETALRQLCRIPFTAGTVRTFRIFADPGGSRTSVDAQVGNVRLRAEEITAGIPRSEQGGGMGWWIALAATAVAALAFVFWRNRQT